MEDNFKEVEKKLKWGQKFEYVKNALYKDEPIGNDNKPETQEEKIWVISLLLKYMDQDEEKNRDKEGKEFYARIRNFISSLST